MISIYSTLQIRHISKHVSAPKMSVKLHRSVCDVLPPTSKQSALQEKLSEEVTVEEAEFRISPVLINLAAVSSGTCGSALNWQ